MMIAARTQATVVTLPRPDRASPPQTLLDSMPTARLIAWSESWADEPLPHLPEFPPELVDALPGALDQARRDLSAGDPGEILAALTAMASRRGLPLPDGIALQMDVEIMASWPPDLWRKAFSSIWERFAYRRFPEVADFRRVIEADLADRKSRLDRLNSLRLKLETLRMRMIWDEQAAGKTCRRSRNAGP
jgi:hypothetical protein